MIRRKVTGRPAGMWILDGAPRRVQVRSCEFCFTDYRDGKPMCECEARDAAWEAAREKSHQPHLFGGCPCKRCND